MANGGSGRALRNHCIALWKCGSGHVRHERSGYDLRKPSQNGGRTDCLRIHCGRYHPAWKRMKNMRRHGPGGMPHGRDEPFRRRPRPCAHDSSRNTGFPGSRDGLEGSTGAATIFSFLISCIPVNPFKAFTEGNMLQVHYLCLFHWGSMSAHPLERSSGESI